MERTITTLRFTIPPENRMQFIDWQTKLNATIALVPGFVSLEILSSLEREGEWEITERFSSSAAAENWRQSLEYKELLQQLRLLNLNQSLQEISREESDLRGGITEILVTEVAPDQLQAYQQWSARIHQLEAKFPGFRGVLVQSPLQSNGKNWITLLQFDTSTNLDRWLRSPERQEILQESSSFIRSFETHRIASPYAGWFASIAKKGPMPPLWKQTMLILLVLFPIVMLELKYLNPLTNNLNRAVGNFIGNAISVSLISFPAMPIALYFLGWWLTPDAKGRMRKTLLGTAIVLMLYLLEIAIFWNFL